MKKLKFCLILFMLMSMTSFAQSIKVSGNVKDDKGNPIIGASVMVVNTRNGSIADKDGNYAITVNIGQTLTCQFLGYKTETAVVNGPSVNFTLTEDIALLDQIVVVGYGSVKKSDLTGSVVSVKNEVVTKVPAYSFEKLLQGRAAGLQVITNDDPGSGATIRIRGGSSIYSSNTPLVVINGFPAGDAGALKQISPNDIESIDVLKDASASAIYGSRGSNGVIIVTTKQAKNGVTNVEISNQTSFSNFASTFDQYSSPLLMAQLSNEAFNNAGLTPLYIGSTDANGVYYPSLQNISDGTWPYFTDWASLVFRQTPVTTNTNVSVSSSNEKTNFSLSMGFLTQQGISIKDAYTKGNMNFTLSHKFTKDITLKLNNILSKDFRNNNKMWLRNPIFPAFKENGDYYLLNNVDYYHPLAIADNVKNYYNGFDNITMLGLDIFLTNWLKFTGQVNYKYGNSVGDSYQPPKYTAEGTNRNGYGVVSNGLNQTITTDALLTFDKSWNIHSLNVMGGYSYTYSMSRSSNLTGEDFINTALGNESLQLGKPEKQRVQTYRSASELVSGMFRANYALMDKYLLTLTSRLDGSSKFGANNKWAFFPSGALSWKAHKEDFIKSIGLFDELKLRFSYGVSGNQGISAYETLPRYGQGLYYYGGAWNNAIGQGTIVGYTGVDGRILVWGGLGNPDLRWETTAQADLGLDLAMFKNKLRLTFDYYNKRTDNLLRDGFVPPSTSFDKVKINGGSILNNGFEITLTGDIIRKSDWGISATAIISKNKNEVVSLGDATRVGLLTDANTDMQYQYWGSVPSGFRETGINILAVGKPVNVYYGYKVNGIIQTEYEGLEAGLTGDLAKPGEFKYVDLDGNGEINENDKTIIGDPNPDFMGSLAMNFRYKNFEAEVFLNGSYGNDIFNTSSFGTARTQPLRWTKDNPTNDYPSLRQSRYEYKFSDWWIEDGSYLKIQNVNLSYNFGINKSKYFISGVKLTVNATNLWTFTKFKGYDPEVGLDGIYWGGLPRQRQLTLGLSIKF